MENGLLARDLKHQLWRINHIPANFHRYPGVIQEKEVGGIDCRNFSCCRPSAHRSSSSTYMRNNFKFKGPFPRRKLLTSLLVPLSEEPPVILLSHCHVELWFTPPTHARARLHAMYTRTRVVVERAVL